MVTKAEWEAIKASHKNRCVICGKTEKQVGFLEKAHIRAKSKGGTQVLPMCATHHTMYDKDLLSATQLKKIGLTPKLSKKLSPAKKRRNTQSWDTLF